MNICMYIRVMMVSNASSLHRCGIVFIIFLQLTKVNRTEFLDSFEMVSIYQRDGKWFEEGLNSKIRLYRRCSICMRLVTFLLILN